MPKKYHEPKRVVWSEAIPSAIGTSAAVVLLSSAAAGDVPWSLAIPIAVVVAAIAWVGVPLLGGVLRGRRGRTEHSTRETERAPEER